MRTNVSEYQHVLCDLYLSQKNINVMMTHGRYSMRKTEITATKGTKTMQKISKSIEENFKFTQLV